MARNCSKTKREPFWAKEIVISVTEACETEQVSAGKRRNRRVRDRGLSSQDTKRTPRSNSVDEREGNIRPIEVAF